MTKEKIIKILKNNNFYSAGRLGNTYSLQCQRTNSDKTYLNIAMDDNHTTRKTITVRDEVNTAGYTVLADPELAREFFKTWKENLKLDLAN